MTQKEEIIHQILPGRQMSEAFINSIFLALSGGLQDAYTFNCRDGVFSNAQTGNVVLMSQSLMMGKWAEALQFFLPILAFAAGVFLVENFHYRFHNAKRLHWRQGILIAEIILLAFVGFLPQQYNMLATIIISFSCAMQVQAFRKVGGYSYASTMCIGNLRSGTAVFSLYLRERKKEQLHQSLYYFGVIIAFAVGAGIGGVLTIHYGFHVIWLSCLLLFISFLLMSLEKLKDSAEISSSQKH